MLARVMIRIVALLAMLPQAAANEMADSQFAAKSDDQIVVSKEGLSESFELIQPRTSPWATTIADAAKANGLPAPFLAKILRQESAFFSLAVSSAGAQGIAQFMPATARFRGLQDPFDPQQAIPAAAQYLKDLHSQFGNLGLAAAAYNGGPGRVMDWLTKGKQLPAETRNYVFQVTGLAVEEWSSGASFKLDIEKSGAEKLVAARLASQTMRKRKSPASVEQQLCGQLKSCVVQKSY